MPNDQCSYDSGKSSLTVLLFWPPKAAKMGLLCVGNRTWNMADFNFHIFHERKWSLDPLTFRKDHLSDNPQVSALRKIGVVDIAKIYQIWSWQRKKRGKSEVEVQSGFKKIKILHVTLDTCILLAFPSLKLTRPTWKCKEEQKSFSAHPFKILLKISSQGLRPLSQNDYP